MKNLSKENFFFFSNDCSEFEIKPNSLCHAYLAILNDDLDAAEAVFSKLDSPRAKWGRILVTILKGYITELPSYFAIRNFLEIDLDFLLKNNKIDYVELCLGALDILSTINQETFKFAARVMLENKLYTSALKYMDRSKQIYYNDPELHFMYAKYYMDVNKFNDAYFYINECLKLLPDYYPAKLLKQKIEEIGF
jgi:tetratricopeptide (TPR) repeat protein